MIRINNVTRKFGKAVAVDGVTFTVPQGDSVALWGANGAGKTTLIRCVLGLIACRGSVTIGGHDVACDGKRARSLIGYVPQELGFYDDLAVGDAVAYFARLKGLRLASVEATLARVALTGNERKRVRDLSGGMKQRLALAIAMLGDPPILVLDEVTASLDACGREEFVSLLSRLSGDGRTMLFASHRIDEVATLARRVVVLCKGRVEGEHDAATFGLSLSVGTVLHLTMPRHVRSEAISVLRERGFAPSLNGVGIVVPVPQEQKAVPFRVLAEAKIRVDDFEVLGSGNMPKHSADEESRS
ncbi:MAG TPA: ABC transporter ATP-binding protein [Phycisphaerales bacterium]|nr:ABC transporter ATP-binding protein [Phycisphaerales bacterium]